MMLTSQETQTRRNRLFAFEGGLAWQIAVTPLVAATAGVLRRGPHLGDRPAVWIDDMLTAEARSRTAPRETPILLDMDPAVGLTRQTVHLALQWAARHADC